MNELYGTNSYAIVCLKWSILSFKNGIRSILYSVLFYCCCFVVVAAAAVANTALLLLLLCLSRLLLPLLLRYRCIRFNRRRCNSPVRPGPYVIVLLLLLPLVIGIAVAVASIVPYTALLLLILLYRTAVSIRFGSVHSRFTDPSLVAVIK